MLIKVNKIHQNTAADNKKPTDLYDQSVFYIVLIAFKQYEYYV